MCVELLPVAACTGVTGRTSVTHHLTSAVQETRGTETVMFLSQQRAEKKKKREANEKHSSSVWCVWTSDPQVVCVRLFQTTPDLQRDTSGMLTALSLALLSCWILGHKLSVLRPLLTRCTLAERESLQITDRITQNNNNFVYWDWLVSLWCECGSVHLKMLSFIIM